jgi:1-acyl-sn-glycerol-3-phosphate acyltransferase
MDSASTGPGPSGLATTAGPQELHGRQVRLRGSALARRVLGWAGWRVEVDGLPARQGVIAVYPHTSNWDFIVGLLAKWAMGLDAHFWGKASLFRVPLLGRWMRWLGGVAIDRSAPAGVVGGTVQRFAQARAQDEFFWLALAPEGTRSAGPGWRSGFHRVAVGAQVPLALITMDFGARCVRLQGCWLLSGDAEADMAALAARTEGVRGYRPHMAAPVRLL